MKKIDSRMRDSMRHILKFLLVMKLAAIILLVFSFQALAFNGMSQDRINLNLQNTSILTVFKSIESQSKYRFIFGEDVQKHQSKVNVYAKEATLDYVLQKVLNNTDFKYKTVDQNLVVIVGPASSGNLTLPGALLPPVSGVVRDELGEPLANVSVTVKGSTVGVVTNEDGMYTINAPSNAVLIFSSVGYFAQEISINGRGAIDVVLSTTSTSMDDVVVVAFGRQKKATVTGAIAQIKGEELVAMSVSNVSNMLIGNAPGISGLQVSGEPGRNAANIYIRGISTFAGGSSTQPLIVIDGIEQASERAFDQLNSMDANEIENITVLKDASATAVYGIRGANGVLIVTTKRGIASRPRLSFSANYGFTKATNLMHNVNSYQYALMRNEAIAVESDIFKNLSFENNVFSKDDLEKLRIGRDYLQREVDAMTHLTEAQREALKSSPALYYGSHDLFPEQFGGTGPQKQLNFNVSGGGERVRYFVSLGYFSQGSILSSMKYYDANIESTFDRYNFRTNFDINVIKNLEIAVNLAGQFGETNGPGLAGGTAFNMTGRYNAIMQYLFDSNPLTAPGIIDGKLVRAYAGQPGSVGNPLALKIGSIKGEQNPARNLLVSGNEVIYNSFLTSSIVARYKMDAVTKGLAFRATVNYDDNYNKTVTYVPSLPSYLVRRNPYNPLELQFFGGGLGVNQVNAYPGRNSTWHKTYYDVGLDYANRFGDHTVSGLLLGKAQKYFIPTQNNFFTPSGIMGLLGRATYNYKEKYLLELNAGYNGTEQFIEGRRFGWFPAYSAGWVISNEDFFPQGDVLTFLKLRGSYGEVGNDQLNSARRYLYLPSTYNLGSGGYYFGPSDGSSANPYTSGAAEGTIGNPDVTWERAKKTNAGIDMRFIKDKLSLTADFFKEKRTGILTDLSAVIPFALGVGGSSTPPVNIGRVENQGYELVLGWTDRAGEFGYHLTGNVNYAKNKILYMAESPKPHPWMYAAGFPVGQYKGLVTDGFYNTEAELQNRPFNTYNGDKVTLGDVKYVDINGDDLIDYKDMRDIGYSNLPQYTFSLKGGMNWKGFDLSFLFTGTRNGSFNMERYQFVKGQFFQTAGYVLDWQYDGRWTPEKVAAKETIHFPRATMHGGAGGIGNFLASDLWLVSTDYIRLKNVELGYRFMNNPMLNRIGVNALRFYMNANNIHTFKSDMMKYGIDPESANSAGFAIYPLTRVFVFGLSVQF